MRTLRPLRFCMPLAVVLAASFPATAQDNILVYGNSIIQGPVTGYLSDIVVQTGAPAPNIVSFIQGNASTQTYVAQQGLITSSLPAGQTWRAMTVEGGTIETTLGCGCGVNGDPIQFTANMLTLAAALYAHSPQSQFVGHETGADHPTSNRYPAWFPDAATWLSFPHRSYKFAEESITAAHPASPPARTAQQGTNFASTAGYPLNLYSADLHHLSTRGKALTACLYYVAIYGGRICDIPVDYSAPTPLVNRLIGHGISEEEWVELASFADRGQPRSMRPYPGSDSDFQLRTGISTSTNLCPHKTATLGGTLNMLLVSPLDANTNDPALLYVQILPTGTLPNGGAIPGLQLDRLLLTTWFTLSDLTGGTVATPIPGGLSGQSLWLQALSYGPVGNNAFPFALSDAQVVDIQ